MPSDTFPSSGNTEQAYYGRLSEGRTARAEDARVCLSGKGIEILVTANSERITWPYSTLSANEPLRKHAIDVLLSSSAQPGSKLFVQGADFTRSLAQRAPQLTARAERWRHARPWLAGTLALMALYFASSATGFSPAHGLATIVPESWRERLGAETIQSMTEDHKRCTDPAGVAAMEKMMRRLSDGAGRTEPFKVVVADWSLINAFAVPGSQIVMTRGLIEKASSADEVAGVLAHEMGHAIHLDPETGIIRAVGMAAALEIMMGGSGGSLANLGMTLAQLGYTRAAEHEADVEALKLLKEAKVSPKGFGDFFERIEKEEGGGEGEVNGGASKGRKSGNADKPPHKKGFTPFDLLRSHPPTEERAALVRAQAPYPATPVLDEESWKALKSVCSKTEDAVK